MKLYMNSKQSEIKTRAIKDFSAHVSSGKAAFFQKYGMHLLRLTLERSSNASRALELMVQLLSDFGQGGICGYEDKHIGEFVDQPGRYSHQ